MTLTKTQKALLERAARNAYGRTSVITGFITSRSPWAGNRTYGGRERTAAYKLVDAGLFIARGADRSSRRLAHGFGEDHGCDHGFEITAAGRAAIEVA